VCASLQARLFPPPSARRSSPALRRITPPCCLSPPVVPAAALGHFPLPPCRKAWLRLRTRMGFFPWRHLPHALLGQSGFPLTYSVCWSGNSVGMRYLANTLFLVLASSPISCTCPVRVSVVSVTNKPSNAILCSLQRAFLYILFLSRYVALRIILPSPERETRHAVLCKTTMVESFTILCSCKHLQIKWHSSMRVHILGFNCTTRHDEINRKKLSSLFYSGHSINLQPRMRVIIKSITLAAIVVAPFIAYHFVAYVVFCSETSSSPTWCSQIPPSIYTHVQSTYWNVGFLHYWTLSQLPNFLLAAPTLLVILAFSLHHLKGTGLDSSKRRAESQLHCAFHNPTITPHAIHGIIFSFILIFASHTQIVLRLAASMPLVYWAAVWLLSEHPSLGRLWVTWSVLWGITSVICWATFLPPA